MTGFVAVLARVLFCLMLGLALPSGVRAASCVIASQGVSFGQYDPFSPSDLDGVGYVRLGCDATVNATISLSAGSGSFSPRLLSNGRSTLGYNLFTSAQRISVWGDGSAGSQTVSVSAQAADVPVYGRITARQNVTTGSYQDLIVVTVTY